MNNIDVDMEMDTDTDMDFDMDSDWTLEEQKRGYYFPNVFQFDCIQRLDDLEIFEGDFEAGKQAEKDIPGLKVIYAEALPEGIPDGDIACYIATPENIAALQKYFWENYQIKWQHGTKERLQAYLISFLKEEDWNCPVTLEQARAFFTTLCFLENMQADTVACDSLLAELYALAPDTFTKTIDYEKFDKFMCTLIV